MPVASLTNKDARVALLSSASVILLTYAILRMLKVNSDRKPLGTAIKKLETVGKLVESPSEKTLGDYPEYDVVIIGGGTAGCVLAARLSEDPKIKVLLLEAGGSGRSKLYTRIPTAYPRLFHSKADYNLYTVPQQHAAGRQRFWPRAKMLGGCSCINAEMFHAGAPSDYDEWAKTGLEGAEGWAFSEFQQYFLKFEKFVPDERFPGVDTSKRGSSGPIEVGYFGNLSKFCSKWIDACGEAGIPHAPDVNTATGTLGATKIMTYTDSKGMRTTTETSYLTPDVLRRLNLTIATHAQVTKVMFDTSDGKKRAVGVEFSRGTDSPRYRAKARKEVILSAGAVHTPHILLVSGVGPAAHLKENSIPVVHDLPGVGQHLMDHPVVNMHFRLNRGESLMYLEPRGAIETLRMIPKAVQWALTGTGPYTSNIVEAAAFVRSDDSNLYSSSDLAEKLEDTTSAENAPDLELYSSPFAWKEHGNKHPLLPKGELGSVATILLRPTSTGSITLKSADPFDAPVIDPKYLATRHDVAVLVRGVKLGLRLARTASLRPLLDKSADADPALDHALHTKSDSDLEAVVRERAETLYHPTCTARMAKLEDGGVVDAYLRVHGIDGLRVVDASVFPTINSGHTAAPTIAVAERAADIIKQQIGK